MRNRFLYSLFPIHLPLFHSILIAIDAFHATTQRSSGAAKDSLASRGLLSVKICGICENKTPAKFHATTQRSSGARNVIASKSLWAYICPLIKKLLVVLKPKGVPTAIGARKPIEVLKLTT
ncbi:hypothetical protein NIASO_08395 [Niabella soli DSM 19437]|uniref:Secreted protein n=1 Tax=Niabella soli DSM 19437 TaxID=929713 RepID=W0F7Z4_9BACT|nr:hypothetical protein NIASO_08395 [Niabella soli DSM 19437]